MWRKPHACGHSCYGCVMGNRSLCLVVLLPMTAWAVAAIYFDARAASWLRITLAVLYLSFAIVTGWRFVSSGQGILLWLGSLALVIGWWLTLRPSNNLPWQPDVERLPSATVKAGHVTLHNVRNFDYRTETDYIPRWETRTVELSQMQGVDIFVTHWGAPLIAHVIVSFRFGDGGESDTFVSMSIEARKTVQQEYSAVRGLFRQYTLIYLVADERDVVRLRTNYRKDESVRLYHTLLNPEDARGLFLQYLQWIEAQRTHPQWYNALTANCSSSVASYLADKNIGGFSKWDPRVILSGLAEKMLYQKQDLATGGLSFEDLKRQAEINDAAKKLDQEPGFSIHIRQGRPGF